MNDSRLPADPLIEDISTDAITPARLEHLCDQIFIDGKLDQSYNYLSYDFVCDDVLVKARAYLDTISQVDLFGPYRHDIPAENQAPLDMAFPAAVLDYLKRRFSLINALGKDGYDILWQHPKAAQ